MQRFRTNRSHRKIKSCSSKFASENYIFAVRLFLPNKSVSYSAHDLFHSYWLQKYIRCRSWEIPKYELLDYIQVRFNYLPMKWHCVYVVNKGRGRCLCENVISVATDSGGYVRTRSRGTYDVTHTAAYTTHSVQSSERRRCCGRSSSVLTFVLCVCVVLCMCGSVLFGSYEWWVFLLMWDVYKRQIIICINWYGLLYIITY